MSSEVEDGGWEQPQRRCLCSEYPWSLKDHAGLSFSACSVTMPLLRELSVCLPLCSFAGFPLGGNLLAVENLPITVGFEAQLHLD